MSISGQGYDIPCPTQRVRPPNIEKNTYNTRRTSSTTLGVFNCVLTVHPRYNVTCLKAILPIGYNTELLVPYIMADFHHNTFKLQDGERPAITALTAWQQGDVDIKCDSSHLGM